MNSKLKEFADKAVFFNDRYASQEEFAEQFAEMIVRECADRAYSQDIMAGDKILKQFGYE
jgi:hypothetical protein